MTYDEILNYLNQSEAAYAAGLISLDTLRRIRKHTDKELTPYNKIKDRRLDEFELSARLMHVFNNDNIHTVGDLIKYTRQELMFLPNFGKKCMEEVMWLMEHLDTSLAYKG